MLECNFYVPEKLLNLSPESPDWTVQNLTLEVLISMRDKPEYFYTLLYRFVYKIASSIHSSRSLEVIDQLFSFIEQKRRVMVINFVN